MDQARKTEPDPDRCQVCGHSIWNHRTDRRIGCIHRCGCTETAFAHRDRTARNRKVTAMRLLCGTLVGGLRQADG